MNDPLMITILILLLSGVFGGLTNFFMSDEENKKVFNVLRSIFTGVCASFMVPLFLNMISSNLLQQIHGSDSNPGDPLKYLVLAGFCLVAAISARAFIQIISNRLLNELRETKKQASNAEKVAIDAKSDVDLLTSKETEQSDEISDQRHIELTVLSEDEQKVLKAMSTGEKYFFRTVTGIAKQTEMKREDVIKIFNELMSKGLINRRQNEKGTWWFVTFEGRRAISDS